MNRLVLAESLRNFHWVALREINPQQFRSVEERMPNARLGVRVLVCRSQQTVFGHQVQLDYVTVRHQAGWEHVTVAYPLGEHTPYPYRFDATAAHPLPGEAAAAPNPIRLSPIAQAAMERPFPALLSSYNAQDFRTH